MVFIHVASGEASLARIAIAAAARGGHWKTCLLGVEVGAAQGSYRF